MSSVTRQPVVPRFRITTSDGRVITGGRKEVTTHKSTSAAAATASATATNGVQQVPVQKVPVEVRGEQKVNRGHGSVASGPRVVVGKALQSRKIDDHTRDVELTKLLGDDRSFNQLQELVMTWVVQDAAALNDVTQRFPTLDVELNGQADFGVLPFGPDAVPRTEIDRTTAPWKRSLKISNDGSQAVNVMPLTPYCAEVASFCVLLRHPQPNIAQGSTAVPVDDIVRDGQPWTVLPQSFVYVDLIARPPKTLNNTNDSHRALRKQWVIFKVWASVGAEAKVTTVRPSQVSLLGKAAEVLWSKSDAPLQNRLDKLSKRFIPKKLKGIFVARPKEPHMFVALPSNMHPTPSGLRNFRHIYGLNARFDRDFVALAHPSMRKECRAKQEKMVQSARKSITDVARAEDKINATVQKGSGASYNQIKKWSQMCRAKWNTLLDIEELQMQLDICEYDLFHTRLQLKERLSATGVALINVPGAAEFRPRCTFGAPVRIRLARNAGLPTASPPSYDGMEMEAAIVSVRNKTNAVTLQLPFVPVDPNSFDKGALVHVRFEYPKRGLLLMRRAIFLMLCSNRKQYVALLCPQSAGVPCSKRAASQPRQAFFHKSLNSDQRLAVEALLAPRDGNGKEISFLLTGPAGTGKTLVVVEAVLQAVRRGYKVAVAASSNAAADVLAERLRPFFSPMPSTPPASAAQPTPEGGKLGFMLRHNTHTRLAAEVRPTVLQYCHTNRATGLHVAPPAHVLQAVDVVVGTCTCLSELYRQPLQPGHFGLIIVDEAAQATEPETMCALILADEKTKVLLSGDPYQLGPEVRSSAASKLGLEMSMLARLNKLEMYTQSAATSRQVAQRQHGATIQNFSFGANVDGIVAVRLRKNYRSQRDLLALPSRQFYNNDLQACVDPSKVNFVQDWSELHQDAGGVLETRWEQHDAPHATDHEAENKSEELQASSLSITSQGGSKEEEDNEEEYNEHHRTPLVFVGVNGSQDNEIDSPSFFNQAEAVKVSRRRLTCFAVSVCLCALRADPRLFFSTLDSRCCCCWSACLFSVLCCWHWHMQVCAIVQALLSDPALGAASSKIGVLTPYRSQVCVAAVVLVFHERSPSVLVLHFAGFSNLVLYGHTVCFSKVVRIRDMLRDQGHGAVRVGTVNDYQGQEEHIVVVSTVVSAKVGAHVHRNVGVIENPGRYNVAITRGKAMSIIVGNPNFLVRNCLCTVSQEVQLLQ